MNVQDQYKDKSEEELKKIYNEKANSVAVGCINLAHDSNIGIMMRTASLFALNEFYIFGRRKYDVRSTVGTYKHIPNERIYIMDEEVIDEQKLKAVLTKLQEKYMLVFIEQNANSISLNELREYKKEMKKPPMFIFGSEKQSSIPESILEMHDTITVEIPIEGIGRSFNVSTACAIVLWEWFRDAE